MAPEDSGSTRIIRQIAEIDTNSSDTGTSGTGPGKDKKTFTFYKSSPLLTEDQERIQAVAEYVFKDLLEDIKEAAADGGEADDAAADDAAADGAQDEEDSENGDDEEDEIDFGRYRCQPLKWIRNGFFQHLFWLGTGGWVIVNYYDKEILLYDPWPSCNELPFGGYDFLRGTGLEAAGDYGLGNVMDWLTDYTGLDDEAEREEEKGVERLEAMANFLRCGVAEGYKISGILVSHDHFDHTDDIAYLMELLLMKGGKGRNHMAFPLTMLRDPLTEEQLPKVYADYEAIDYVVERIKMLSDKKRMIMAKLINACREQGVGLSDVLKTIEENAEDDEESEEAEEGDEGDKAWKNILKALGKKVLGAIPELLKSDVFTKSDDEAWNKVRQYYGSFDSSKYVEIKSEEGQRMRYNDEYNFRLTEPSQKQKAGVPCQEIEVGHFKVKPYVWDHSKLGGSCGTLSHRNSGAYQRITAFLIYHKDAEQAKKTFVIGSAGPMHPDHSAHEGFPDHVQDLSSQLEVDMLLDALLPQDIPLLTSIKAAVAVARGKEPTPSKLDAMLKYQRKNLKVKDFVVATHWEDFDWILGGSATTEEFSCGDEGVTHMFGGDYIKVIDYIKARERIIGKEEGKKVFVLGRAGFEWAYPASPNKLREELWTDPLIEGFEETGPWRDTPEHLAALALVLKDVILKKKEPIELLRELAKMEHFSLIMGATLAIIEIVVMAQFAASLTKKDDMEEGQSEEGTWAQYDSYKELMPVIRRITGRTLGQISSGFI